MRTGPRDDMQVSALVEWQPSCSSIVLADHLEMLAEKGKLSSG